ncbi:hypothetical protein F5Y15DRAFT_381957 [Xylariaceae sp. FL0016]|nr:hypothetical protein F5Y15DRAFT_381957 [Xylariaceae sp. FL0016]
MPCSVEAAVAITTQKARYARYADTKQWDKFAAEVALPDCIYSYRGVDGEVINLGSHRTAYRTTTDFIAFFQPFFARLQTLHNFSPGDFEQTGDDVVQAVFAFEDQLMIPQLGAWAEIRGGGHYYETWRRVEGVWKLEALDMKRTYQKMTALVAVALFLQEKLGITLL